MKANKKFDWHSDVISDSTLVDSHYKTTQNVCRFMVARCGSHFKFNREFMAWICDDEAKTMGDVASKWLNNTKA
ncbi:MAG: hypothetical protein H7228_16520 [Polaromonas sp.]|nr:hypothetical protein [Polaromonas sp.]